MPEARFPPDLLEELPRVARYRLVVALSWARAWPEVPKRFDVKRAFDAIPPALLGQFRPGLPLTLPGTLLQLEMLHLVSDAHPLGDGWWGATAT